jgi:hypothetical protein
MKTRIRYIDSGDCREASCLIDDPKLDPPLRMWIEAERNGLLRIGLVAVTSRSESAEEQRGRHGTFWLTRDDVRWFIEQLPAALAYVEGSSCTCNSAEGPPTCPEHGEPLYRRSST